MSYQNVLACILLAHQHQHPLTNISYFLNFQQTFSTNFQHTFSTFSKLAVNMQKMLSFKNLILKNVFDNKFEITCDQLVNEIYNEPRNFLGKICLLKCHFLNIENKAAGTYLVPGIWPFRRSKITENSGLKTRSYQNFGPSPVLISFGGPK